MLLSLASASIYARKTSHPEPTLAASVKAIVTSSWFNLLVVFIPVSWALHYAKPDEDVMIFVCKSCGRGSSVILYADRDFSLVSFLALVPLAQLLGFATEEISMRVGQTLAGLLNATMGNVPELLVAAIALSKCQLRIVQSSLIGSILSNLLLVLGMCFFAGGTHFSEQGFSIGAAQINSSLLMLSSVAVLLPALLYFAVTTGSASAASATDAGNDILKISHGAALLLLIIYLCYLYFQLRSHAYVYADVNNPEVPASLKYGERRKPAPAMNDSEAAHSDNNEDEKPSVSLVVCIGLMVIVTVLIAFTSEALVDSIDGTASKAHINKEFIGLMWVTLYLVEA
jgi:Ca2+:H+ antiporter